MTAHFAGADLTGLLLAISCGDAVTTVVRARPVTGPLGGLIWLTGPNAKAIEELTPLRIGPWSGL